MAIADFETFTLSTNKLWTGEIDVSHNDPIQDVCTQDYTATDGATTLYLDPFPIIN